MMKRLVLPLGAAMVLSMVALSPASAFTMTQKCVIANELCFVSRASAGGFNPEQRIDRVNERLAYILRYENLRPGNIRMVAMGPDVQIRVGRSLLVTVTPADARGAPLAPQPARCHAASPAAVSPGLHRQPPDPHRQRPVTWPKTDGITTKTQRHEDTKTRSDVLTG